MALDLENQVELHPVQLLVRPDEARPDHRDRDAEEGNGECPPALAEASGLDAVQGDQTDVEGEKQAV